MASSRGEQLYIVSSIDCVQEHIMNAKMMGSPIVFVFIMLSCYDIISVAEMKEQLHTRV